MVLLSEIAIRMYLYFLYCLETRCVYANLSPSLHLGKKPPSCEVPFPSSPLPGNKHNMNKTWPICQDLRIQPSFHLFLLQMIGVWMNYCYICSLIKSFYMIYTCSSLCIQDWNEFSLALWAVKIVYFCLIKGLKETKQMLFWPVCLLKCSMELHRIGQLVLLKLRHAQVKNLHT